MSIDDTWSRLARYGYVLEWLSGRDVLEIGCGDGSGAALLADHAARVVSGDADPDVVARARLRTTRANLELRTLDPTAPAGLDFPDGAFDVVCVPSADAWIHDPRFLIEIRRLLRAGGFLYVAVASADRPGASAGVGYHDFVSQLQNAFPAVRPIAQTPGIHFTLTEFAPEGEIDPALDGSLLQDDEPCSSYVALCGEGELPRPGYSVLTVPRLALAEDDTLTGAADTVRLEARAAQAEARADLLDAELREERAKARREPTEAPATVDASALEGEAARLRREIEAAQAAERAAQEQVAALEAQRQADAWRVEEDVEQANRRNEELEAFREGAKLHEEEAVRLRAEASDLRALNEELQGERDEVAAERARLAEQVSGLTARRDELERETSNRGMRIAELEGQIKGQLLREQSDQAGQTGQSEQS
jgi:SAM-dependent methyltransferase